MPTVIRFARHGTKKRPHFRIVVQDSRCPRDGRFIEHIGVFNPQKPDSLNVKRDRLEYWLGAGAQISTSVKNRLRSAERAPKVEKVEQPQAAPPPPKKAEDKQAPQDKEG